MLAVSVLAALLPTAQPPQIMKGILVFYWNSNIPCLLTKYEALISQSNAAYI